MNVATDPLLRCSAKYSDGPDGSSVIRPTTTRHAQHKQPLRGPLRSSHTHRACRHEQATHNAAPSRSRGWKWLSMMPSGWPKASAARRRAWAASAEPSCQHAEMGDGRPSATSMKQGGRADERKRCRATIEVECNLPAKPHWCSRAASLLQHPPNPSCNTQDAVSGTGQLSTTRLLSALNKASRPHWYHRWDAAGALSPCVRPSVRALVTPDGSDEIASCNEKDTPVKR